MRVVNQIPWKTNQSIHPKIQIPTQIELRFFFYVGKPSDGFFQLFLGRIKGVEHRKKKTSPSRHLQTILLPRKLTAGTPQKIDPWKSGDEPNLEDHQPGFSFQPRSFSGFTPLQKSHLTGWKITMFDRRYPP